MRINESAANMEGAWFQRSNSVDRETKQMEKMISEMNKIEEVDEKTLSEEHNFRALCKKFPEISFVVVDGTGAPLSKYSGICNTSAFGDFGQISIEVDEEIIKNLANDWDNIVTKIQMISDHYDEFVAFARAEPNCLYTGITLCYGSAGKISWIQSYWSEPPTYLREYWDLDDLRTNDKYLQALLLKMQKDVFDKLFEIGEDKQEHKMKTASKAVEEYQEHFVYEKEEI